MYPAGYCLSMNLKKTLAALLAGLLTSASLTVAASALEPHGTGLKMRNWLINDPNYQFSDAYKTSVWYANFSSLELGSNDRNNVLRVAVSQLGYHEGDSPDEFHGMNIGGTGNYMEYGRLLVPNWNNNSFDWCACFVNWCLNQARFDKASSEISCGNWIAELKTMEMWQSSPAYGGTYIPKPADLIFFDWDETGKWSEHIGLVLYTTSTKVYTIEGNTKTENVAVRSYSLNDPCVLGYGTPPYDEGDEPTADYSYAGGMPKGTYVVGSAEACLTDAQGNDPSDSVPLGSTVTLLTENEDRVLVSYMDKQGYLPKNSLFLLSQTFSLTYQANGGTNPPEAQTAEQGHATAISDTLPTMEGDTFLGWSTVPYNLKVDFKAWAPIVLTKDTTLYAVWQKHSRKLAAEALAQGLVPEYERPGTIRNSSAILLGGLDSLQSFTDFGGTNLQFTQDEAVGKVLSLVSDGEAAGHYVTMPYGSLCKTLRLSPVTGGGTAYVILRVKDVNTSGLSVKLTFNGQASTSAVSAQESGDWQYLVFDLADGGFTGELDTLRIEWQGSSSDAACDLLISDIFFAPNAAYRDALVKGKYVYPVQELLAAETAPETDPETTETPPEVSETRGESATAAVTVTDSLPSESTESKEPTTETEPKGSGCNAVLRTSAWISAVLFLCIPVMVKKKED